MKFLLVRFVASTILFGLATVHAEDNSADAPPTKVEVTLLKQGDEPRQKLRYQFQEGVTEILEVKMKMGMAMKMAGQAMPKQDMPAILQTLEINPNAVKNGVMDYQFKLTKMELEGAEGMNPMIVSAMKKAANGLVGMSGTGTVDDRGFSDGNTIEMPEDADPAMVQQIKGLNDTMQRISSPLPDEPIGVGGEWKVEMPISMNGVTMKGVNTYKVLGFVENGVKTEVHVSMAAENQELNDPNLPPTAKLMIDSIVGEGTGTVNFNFVSMCPVSKMTMGVKQNATINIEGQPEQKMNIDIDMKMYVRPGVAEVEQAEEKKELVPSP